MIENLDTLLALSKFKTMTRTATFLRLTQSAVSKRIALLEGHIGVKLIEKQGRHVVLTPEGLCLIERSAPLLGDLRVLLNIQASPSLKVLSLGVSESIMSSWGPRLFKSVVEQTDLRFEYYTHRSPVVRDQILSGRYLMGLCAGKFTPKGSSLFQELLFQEEIVLIPCQGAKKKQDIPLITIEKESATWAALKESCSKLGLKPDMTLGSFFAVAQMAQAGHGHGLVPMGVAQALGYRKNQVTRFKNQLQRPIYWIARKTVFQQETIQNLIQCFRSFKARDIFG